MYACALRLYMCALDSTECEKKTWNRCIGYYSLSRLTNWIAARMCNWLFFILNIFTFLFVFILLFLIFHLIETFHFMNIVFESKEAIYLFEKKKWPKHGETVNWEECKLVQCLNISTFKHFGMNWNLLVQKEGTTVRTLPKFGKNEFLHVHGL